MMEMSANGANDSESEVQQFYNGASVLVTGATGFMGKVLVEKLLWSCTNVKTIYLLLRTKKGKSVHERVEELIRSPCFDRLRKRSPGFKAKLVVIPGDLLEKGLGVSDQDRHLLAEHVTVVFHVAATIRFDEPLATAIKQNVRATRDLLALCRTCSRLKAVVHISTMYANFPLPEIEERFYDTHLNCDKLIEMVEELPENETNSKTEQLLGTFPNTYVFTKALAEQVVRIHGKDLPVAISRPGAVISSSMEPASGWIDNYYGPPGMIASIASGVLRAFYLDGTVFAELVPCDMAINSAIVAAWEVAEKRSISQGVPIYNYSSPVANRITWGQYFDKNTQASVEMPSSDTLCYPYHVLLKNRTMAVCFRFLLHILSANLMDTNLKIQGKPARMSAAYAKIHKYNDLIHECASSPRYHEERNVPALWELTSKRDKELFPFDMRALDWDSYVQRSFLGIRKFLLKENEENIPAARSRLRRLFWFHCAALGVPSVLLCRAVFSKL